MRRTPWPRLVLIAGVVAVGSAGVLNLLRGQGQVVLGPPVLSSLVMLLLAAIVGRMGWNVRQFVQGKRPGLDPLLAARTVVLATAAAYTGAVLAGWYAGHVLVVLGALDVESQRAVAVNASVALAGALVLGAVGLLAEHWCEVPPDDEDRAGGVSAGSPA